MKAVILAGVGDVRVEDVAEPTIQDPGDAIVEVRATAICGADLFPFHGMTPGFEDGTVLGHEFAGVVVELGSDVHGQRIGQRVVNTSMISDGTCASCKAGRVTQCAGRSLFGYSGVYPRLDGGQAELVRVPNADRCLHVLPDSVSDEAAVFLADILPTGFGAVQRGGVGPDSTVVVVGCGPVGLMAIMCAVGEAKRVLAVDGIPERRRIATLLGAQALEPADARRRRRRSDRRAGCRRGDRGGRFARRARRLASARTRSRDDLGGRGALRARLPVEQRPDVRARADAAVHDRRPLAGRRGPARPRRRQDARPDAGDHAPHAAGRRGGGLPAVRCREATKVVLAP